MSSFEQDDELFDDETSVTEITFLPDGRCCLFGASKEIVQLLKELNLVDQGLTRRLAAIQAAEQSQNSIQTNEHP